MEFYCSKIEELNKIAEELIKQHSHSTVFSFYGSMGSGKTTFIKAICNYLGTLDVAISPSFGLVNEYKTADNKSVFHFDFYRIKNNTEYFDIGCEEYLSSGAYCFLEWPEKVEELLPSDCVKIYIEIKNGDRLIKF